MLRSWIRSAALLAVVALLAAGCGGNNSSSGGSSGSGSSTEIKVFAAASLTAAFNKIGQDYTAANPNAKVTFNFAGSRALDAQHVTVKPVSLEDNVKAVVTKVSLGEADAGIVYVTDVTAGGDKVEGVGIPTGQNVRATYPIATVKASSHQPQAQAFADYVRGDQGQQVLEGYGFLPPPTS